MLTLKYILFIIFMVLLAIVVCISAIINDRCSKNHIESTITIISFFVIIGTILGIVLNSKNITIGGNMNAEQMFRNLNYKEIEKQDCDYDKMYESTKNEIGDTFKICFNSKNKTIDFYVYDSAIRLFPQDIIAIYNQIMEMNFLEVKNEKEKC